MKNPNRWAIIHSIIILGSSALSFLLDSLIPLASCALASFILLMIRFTGEKSENNLYTPANIVTLIRLGLVLVMAVFYYRLNNFLIASIGLVVLAGDGLDGKIARTRNEISELGEYLDKETDSLFLHIMVMMAVFKNIVWEGTVILGLLRYLFVLTVFFLGDPTKKERRSRTGRYIFVYAAVSLILVFFPLPAVYVPAVILAGLLLFYSFGKDFLWLFSEK